MAVRRYICLLALVCLPSLAGSQTMDNGVSALNEYVDLLATGNIESAQDYFHPSCLARSQRFGIQYTGLPVRPDVTSPVQWYIMSTDIYPNPGARLVNILEQSKYAQVKFSEPTRPYEMVHEYYTYLDGNAWWLIFPQDYYAKDWPVVESRFLRVHVHPDRQSYVNTAALEEADQFVLRLMDTLKLSKDDRKLIESERIEYFFCSNDSTVTKITGQRTTGLLDLASNDVISSDFPHYHELTHLLVNIKLKQLPLMTLPILREGLATQYGGRWGKRTSALMDLGNFLVREDLVELDSLLTQETFSDGTMADIAYPVAASFTAFLQKQLGPVKFYTLYLALSADPLQISKFSRDSVKATVATALGKPAWADVRAAFNEYLTAASAVTAALPQITEGGKSIAHQPGVKVTSSGEWLSFEFDKVDSTTQGTLFFSKDPRFSGGKSLLFLQQFGEMAVFHGYRYAVRFDVNEAGLYDYATNELVAKYIWGMTPSEKYYDPSTKTIRVQFRRSLLGKVEPTTEDMKLTGI